MLPKLPGQIPTVFVAFATNAGTPNPTSVGNDTIDPPPATELIPPATKAAANAAPSLGKSPISIAANYSPEQFPRPSRKKSPR